MFGTAFEKSNANSQNMKQTLFSLLLILGATTAANAQSTITGANFNPVAGDRYYGHDLVADTFTAGPSGANITWDFSMAALAGSGDTTTYYACSAGTMCDSFTGVTLFTVSFGDTLYYSFTSSAYSMVGFRSSGTIAKYYNPQDFLRYPFTYNSMFVDTGGYRIPAYMSSHFQRDTIKCDAYGTLKLPGRTETGVLRMHATGYVTDTFAGYGTSYKTELYVWLKPGFHSPLLVMSYDTSGGTRYISNFAYYTGPQYTTGVDRVITNVSGLTVYPNPAASEVTIITPDNFGAADRIDIIDMTGATVSSVTPAATSKVTISTANLPNGNYLVRCLSAGNVTTTRLAISRN